MRRSVWALMMLLGCGDDHGEGDDHEHEHGDEHGDEHGHEHGDEHAPEEHSTHGEQQVTRWSDTLEAFIEHPIAVAGEELHMHVHLTKLDDFEALDGARIRLVLEGPETLRATANGHGGIYEPHLTPRLAGTYRGRIEVIEGGTGTVDGIEFVVLDEHEAEALREVRAEEPDGIVFLKEQQWRVPFATAVARRETLQPTMEATGTIATPPDGTAHIHAPVGGRIAAGRRGFPSPGMVVREGEELATLAPTPGAPEEATQAGLLVVRAEAEVEEARAELARTQRLLADRAIPEREVAEAERRLRIAESGLSASRRASSLYTAASSGRGRGSWRIVSPIAGVVDDVRVTPGEAVDPNELIFRVVNSTERWVRSRVPEAWASRVAPNRSVALRMPGDDTWRHPEVELVFVSRTIDPESRTLEVIWRLLSEDEDFRVGASTRVAIPVGEAVESIVIPRSSLVSVEGRERVYVQEGGERFVERTVTTGATDGSRIAITAGLREGERVVTTGANLVRLAEGGGASADPHAGHIH